MRKNLDGTIPKNMKTPKSKPIPWKQLPPAQASRSLFIRPLVTCNMHSKRNDKSEAQIATHKELPYLCVGCENRTEH